jgi:hypothetical protein
MTETADITIECINELVEAGVLGREECPDERYWH